MQCLSAAPDRKGECQSLSFAEIADDPDRSHPEVQRISADHFEEGKALCKEVKEIAAQLRGNPFQ